MISPTEALDKIREALSSKTGKFTLEFHNNTKWTVTLALKDKDPVYGTSVNIGAAIEGMLREAKLLP